MQASGTVCVLFASILAKLLSKSQSHTQKFGQVQKSEFFSSIAVDLSKLAATMKFYLPFFLITTSSCVNSFQNRPSLSGSHRTSIIQRKATEKDTDTTVVTKDDLLGARDEIDKLLREKACGMYTHVDLPIYSQISISVPQKLNSNSLFFISKFPFSLKRWMFRAYNGPLGLA